ncbi:hypothetical protein BJV78DRAFT_1277371 [Lactifluus subvellereus]|nr:hypothetical protein BJV78DRAFT_1277371 [Lactifluus subvellereus]
MVDIYLNVHGSQAVYTPFKWLRYVMFCICGARGDLSATPDSPQLTMTAPLWLTLSVIYYYSPSENCIFVDYEGLNDQITTTKEVIQRDGLFCVITQQSGEHCDAAHLIPWSKGDEYIDRVVRDRSPLYPPSLPLITGIDDVRNGMLLGKDVHSKIADGRVAFLKTPNYGLEPADIPRVGPVHQGPAPKDHITLQQLKKPGTDDPALLATLAEMRELHPSIAFILGAHVNVQFQGTGILLPPAIILDYLYGVAAYNCWRSRQGGDEVHAVMKSYRREHYADIPPAGHQQRPYMSIRRGDVMATAMDEMNSVLMFLQGITPQEAANRREKRMEEELKAQEASQSKVMEWMKTRDVGSS